nr:type 1 glutamine amidotransferase family protein [uncultured Carboxylicivirga sp.]
MKKIGIFLFNGFSDWEISYLTPEINKSSEFELIYFSQDGEPVLSMGGLKVVPTTSLGQINSDELSMLLLPGGTAWEKGDNNAIETLTLKFYKAGKPIAAICAATAFMGQLGLLDQVEHTSNDLYYLKAVAPQYKGDELYQNSPAVSDKNIITAKGIAPIEFASAIFKLIALKPDVEIEKWFQLFKNGIWSE